MASKKPSTVNLSTGEIQEEIEARVADRLLSDPVFRSPMSRVRVPIAPSNEEEATSMTHQAHADSCDINVIIRQFDRTGVLPPAAHTGQYADVSELNDGYDSLIMKSRNAISEAQAELVRNRHAAAVEAAKTADSQKKPEEPNPMPPTPTPPDNSSGS